MSAATSDLQRAEARLAPSNHEAPGRVEAGAPVAEVLKELLQETGYSEALEAERTIEAQGRLENLQELVNVSVKEAFGLV